MVFTRVYGKMVISIKGHGLLLIILVSTKVNSRDGYQMVMAQKSFMKTNMKGSGKMGKNTDMEHPNLIME